MLINEARVEFQLIWFQAEDPLNTTKRLLAHLVKGVPEADSETFWLLAMNSNRRPICRQQLARGPLVAAQVAVPKIFLSLALAEARAFACLRTQPSGPIRPTVADGRLVLSAHAMSKLCHLEFVDYLIAIPAGTDYYSYREHGNLRD